MYNDLLSKIKVKNAKIGIIGLGYVGLPLMVEFAKSGFHVTGYETSNSKIKSLNKGISYVADIRSFDLSLLLGKKLIKATKDLNSLHKQDVVIVCVPTPLRKSKDPDVSYILDATKSITRKLRKGQLIILESTTYPGTTRELLLPLFEKKGLKCGKDIFLAFSPERVDPGNKTYKLKNTPKIVGGITKNCTNLSKLLYSKIANKVIDVSSPEAAEMVKLLENTFRAVNIALVNEVALMCDKLQLNVWEIIDAAASKPFGFLPFYPGPGIGGHCIPLDPQYLSWKLKTLNFFSRFIELAGEINSKMPEYIIQKISDVLNLSEKTISKASILIIGTAYKKNVSDTRESPALDIIKLLKDKKAKVNYFDPFVKKISLGTWELKSLKNLNSIKNYDLTLIITDHSSLDYKEIVKSSHRIFDARNATKGIKSDKIVYL